MALTLRLPSVGLVWVYITPTPPHPTPSHPIDNASQAVSLVCQPKKCYVCIRLRKVKIGLGLICCRVKL